MATGTPEAAFAELREKRQASAASAAAQRWKGATFKAGFETPWFAEPDVSCDEKAAAEQEASGEEVPPVAVAFSLLSAVEPREPAALIAATAGRSSGVRLGIERVCDIERDCGIMLADDTLSLAA